MHQIFGVLGQIAQWCASTPAHQQFTLRLLHASRQSYNRLPQYQKDQVNAIMKKGVVMLTKAALGDVVDWAGTEAVSMGLNASAVDLAKQGVKRASAVGIDKAIKEMEGT